MLKKIQTIGALSLVASPIIAATACFGGSNYDITFGMRADDAKLWAPVIEKFEELTNKKIKLIQVGNQKTEYETMSSTGGLPDVALMDHNTAKYAMEFKPTWFEPLDIAELGKKEYDITENPEVIDFTSGDIYDKPVLDAFTYGSGDNKDNVVGIGYAQSALGIYVNMDNIDEDATIEAIVPQLGSTYDLSKVSTTLKATRENISKFIASSGDVNDEETIFGTGVSAPNGWNDAGPLAMFQRIASIGLSVTKKDTNKKPGWINDLSFPYTIISGLGKVGENYLYDNSTLNDDLLMKLFKEGEKPISDDAIKESLYQSLYGYFPGYKTVDGYSSSPKMEGKAGEADAIWEGIGSIMFGAKWQLLDFLLPNWYKGSNETEKRENLEKDLLVVSSPYGAIGVDGLGVAKDSKNKELAMQFIRFAVKNTPEYRHASVLTGPKTLSPFASARKYSDELLDKDTSITSEWKAIQKAFNNQGRKSDGTNVESVNNITGPIVSSSTKGIYDIFNGKAGDPFNKMFTDDSERVKPMTIASMLEKYETFIDAAYKEIRIQGKN